MDKITTVTNRYDNKKYTVLTGQRSKQIPAKSGGIHEFIEISSVVFLKRIFLTGIFQRPTMIFHALKKSDIVLERLHESIVDFVRKQDLTEEKSATNTFFDSIYPPLTDEKFTKFFLSPHGSATQPIEGVGRAARKVKNVLANLFAGQSLI